MRGNRMVWGGRQQVRTTLDMAALTASPRNPALRAFYQRLAKGRMCAVPATDVLAQRSFVRQVFGVAA